MLKVTIVVGLDEVVLWLVIFGLGVNFIPEIVAL